MKCGCLSFRNLPSHAAPLIPQTCGGVSWRRLARSSTTGPGKDRRDRMPWHGERGGGAAGGGGGLRRHGGGEWATIDILYPGVVADHRLAVRTLALCNSYMEVVNMAQSVGLKMQAIMSFHQVRFHEWWCGGGLWVSVITPADLPNWAPVWRQRRRRLQRASSAVGALRRRIEPGHLLHRPAGQPRSGFCSFRFDVRWRRLVRGTARRPGDERRVGN